MVKRAKEWLGKLGLVERVFLAGLALYVALQAFPQFSLVAVLVALADIVIGFVVMARLARGLIRKMLWRLRNRLIIAYLFIALVPILLILVLAGVTSYWMTVQVSGYLVNAELNRRIARLVRPAQMLARADAERREQMVQSMPPYVSIDFPDLDILAVDSRGEHVYPPDTDLVAPPAGWGNVHGILLKQGRIYVWAHWIAPGAETVLASPLSHEFLSGLVPGLGDVSLVTMTGRTVRLDEAHGPRRDRTPPAANLADIVVSGIYPIPMYVWDEPGSTHVGALYVRTRISAVLALLLGRSVVLDVEWSQLTLVSFLVISGLFLIVELICLKIGVSMTRTITSAVHDLYEGTRRVMEGNFSHRIPVTGGDQMAALGISFNTMTVNLERLIVVAKEKERLQSELEIAREVQNQLFPRKIPGLRTLQMAGVCRPARMVSGDYYDFMHLQESTLAFAIGDVAGKGISAALLMAAIQSTMHTQLTAGFPAAGNGGGSHLSTARMVSLLNKQLYDNTSPEKYATFFLGSYDDESGALTYTNAGHLPPILLRQGQTQLLEVTGTVVGAFPFSAYEEDSIQLLSGDLLVGYTDGIVEPENEYGEMFGIERLTELLVKHSDCEGAEIITKVMDAVEVWTGGGELQDDMTMLVARRL